MSQSAAPPSPYHAPVNGAPPGLSAAEPTDKERLLAVIGNTETLQRTARAARILGGEDAGRASTWMVRLVLLQAGLQNLQTDSLEDFLRLAPYAFQAFPPALSGPEPGDLFVRTDANRQVVGLGWVQKVDIAGKFVVAADASLADNSQPYRLDVDKVDFWLRFICRQCPRPRLAG